MGVFSSVSHHLFLVTQSTSKQLFFEKDLFSDPLSLKVPNFSQDAISDQLNIYSLSRF